MGRFEIEPSPPAYLPNGSCLHTRDLVKTIAHQHPRPAHGSCTESVGLNV